ncbi:hypothetical protein DEIPH_ctg013orf0046 [Deinococcus phoenicis]|uniref:Uncharacterized protein n=1 Tax=Deinococcus phoenicis TaxID=1476583 RepID=A0A016QSA4_9DEIO|nr:hypothetical protein DEIPH_ctg013orf0046 [Deinococcus phoenicis]
MRLDLQRWTVDEALQLTDEGLPDLAPVGTVQDVPGTGLRLYVGGEGLRAGTYTVTVAAHGRTPALALRLQHEVVRAATLTRFVRRGGAELPIARFSRISRKWRGNWQVGSAVDVAFEASSPYWLLPVVTVPLVAGANTVKVEGDGPVSPRLSLTASQTVTNPQITTDAGVTRWLGTLNAGQTLVIDATPGVWSVTVGGLDVRLGLQGPQPLLQAGTRAVTLGANLSGVLTYRPGVLDPSGVSPEPT